MSQMTVQQLAESVGTPVDRLIGQLKEAGVEVDGPAAKVTDAQKLRLLEYLRETHGGERSEGGRMTLKRRATTQTLKVSAGQGRTKTVSVEVRKRRQILRREPEREVAAPVPEPEVAAAEPEMEAAPTVAPEAAPVTETHEPEVPVTEAPEPRPEPAAEMHEEPEEPVAAAPAELPSDLEEPEPASPEPAAEPEEVEPEKAATVPDEGEAEASTQPGSRRALSRTEQLARQVEAEREAMRRAVEQRQQEQEERKVRQERRQREEAEAAARAKAEEQRRLEKEEAQRLLAEKEAKARQEAAGKAEPGRKKGRRGGRDEGGRKELHVAGDRRGRRDKGRSRVAQTAAAAAVASKHGFARPTAPVVREIEIPETITVGELAQAMAIKAPQLIKTLMQMGVMATINQSIDQDTAVLVVEEMGHKAVPAVARSIEDEISLEIHQTGEAKPRPSVVTVMGHVDHGKTSLLDYIRKAKVASGEAGGITQHIGAYHVETPKGGITFLDTPGHAAFTAMRARGAKATDIVILVVAADDGVMPQTIEAVEHAKAGGVPLVVAVNKIDKPDADPDRVMNELSQHGVIPESWGGDTQFVPVSALNGQGIDELLDAVGLQAEVMELQAPDEGPARGVVIESRLDKGRGPVATVLVQAGRLQHGDILLSGQEYGRVRAMFDDTGTAVKQVGPSMPVEILGLSGVPNAGDEVLVVADEKTAREVAAHRETRQREHKLAAQQASKLENIFNQMKEGQVATVNILLKTDVQGSAEALRDALVKLSTDEVRVKVVSTGVGGISESDINLAMASQAIIIAFNVRADAGARRLAAENEIDIRYYSVIYEAIEDVKQALSGLLAPEMREEIVGLAEVRDVFKASGFGAVAGCLVVEGTVKRGNPIRVLRDNVVIFEGELESLRRFKDDVNEVKTGTECGIAVKNYNDVRPGDQIEVYQRVEVARSL
ncbi:Translation initiation factor 2 [Thioalkalivibrio nitratireducens DSM 14787]|uniref:Translation initiation factor IF-2 n=1 Tax=Thioalkalivibrio nitratireducens (strain DSM 14787 / UNIQEM 213 / ALEN2) TaxID=1255043 RepID=L0E0H5_THIND|nr:translation initiation factor IF-2 [Thioalkalivibrio nitratireducens]AGA34747.1 Translation initiation factor 2 [Thioalkalivibrio nitratireducens DSM 14787]